MTGDAGLNLPAPQCQPRPPAHPCENAKERVKSSKCMGQFCRLLATAVHHKKLALLALASVGSYPPGQLVRGKADGSLHQKNIG